MKLTHLSVLALLGLACVSQTAFAQSPVPGSAASSEMRVGSSGSPSGSSGGAAGGSSTGSDASAVTNLGSAFSSDETLTTTTTTTTVPTADITTGEMANTGGEPELMLLAGMALASGGLLIRRKASAKSI